MKKIGVINTMKMTGSKNIIFMTVSYKASLEQIMY